MWIRKSNEELARERRRLWLSCREPAFLFLLCFVLTTISAMQGPRGSVTAHRPITLYEILRLSLFAATVVAIAGYSLQLILGRKLISLTKYGKIVICDTCHRIKHGDRENECKCGGTFENFDKWTWIDEDSDGHRTYTMNDESGLILRPPK